MPTSNMVAAVATMASAMAAKTIPVPTAMHSMCPRAMRRREMLNRLPRSRQPISLSLVRSYARRWLSCCITKTCDCRATV